MARVLFGLKGYLLFYFSLNRPIATGGTGIVEPELELVEPYIIVLGH